MSSFDFPHSQHVHDSTYSTQFSFDEELISPSFVSSPSLSNHASNQSIKSLDVVDDVVEAVSHMQNGCFMIVINAVNMDDRDNCSNIDIEWGLNHLDINHSFIALSNNNRINISEIDTIHTLNDDTLSDISQKLNISALQRIGLQSVALQLIMKNGTNYFLVFDDYQTCFIWNRGLKTIKHMLCIKQPITTIAFCVSTVDRINNDAMYEKMQINNDNNINAWVKNIRKNMYQTQKYINQCHAFAESFCILDSSQHLSLLSQTKSLKEYYFDTNKLVSIPVNELTKNEIISLREVWLSLLAQLTVVMLKEHSLKNDINISRQNREILMQMSMSISK